MNLLTPTLNKAELLALKEPHPNGIQISWLGRIARIAGLTPLGCHYDSNVWKQTFVYDRYGNRTIDQNSANTYGGISKPYFTVDTNTNRLTVPSGQSGTMHYDAAGNLDIDTYSAGAVSRLYDAENRMTKETQASSYVAGEYSYDGDGRRVKRKVNGVETWQVYGIGGELLAEYAANTGYSSPQKEYGYRNGQLLITASVTSGSAGTAFSFADDPLVAGTTVVKAVHLTELRTAVNQARAHGGLSAATWTDDPAQASITPIKAVHITELRTKLNEARVALGLSAAAFTDPGLTTGDAIKAAHVQELRTKTNETLTALAGAGVDVRWLVADQLGTPRMVFDQSGALGNMSRHDYLPFGEALTVGSSRTAFGYTNGDGARQQFTQKERDNETGLDFFNARYFGSTQGRFTSPDPYNPIVDTDKEEEFNEYLGQPQNWNRYAFVWNNPLKYVDPNGEKVYVVTYTTGNYVDNGGDDELRRAAQTKADHIRASKGFNAKKDTVLLRGVQTKEDFANVIKEANGLNKQYGKVEQINLYSHAGPESGPIFHEASPYNHNQTQFTQQELSNLRVNWSGSATARIYGCNTGVNFAQNFANAQGVPTFGYEGFAYFSNSYTSMIPDQGRQYPLYLIQADYGKASGPGGVLRYELGIGNVYPMVRRNPPPKDRPRR